MPPHLTLQTLLRHRHVDALIQDAEVIRTWPDPAEKMNAATRCIRHAMYEQAIGRITEVELQQITDLLSFAIDPVPAPLEDLWQDLLNPEQ